MFMKAIENSKVILTTILVASSLMLGSWQIVSNVFMTRAEAEIKIKKLDLDTSYNKAFMLVEKIHRLKKKPKPLSEEEQRNLRRLQKDLQRTDNHIDILEDKIYK